MLKAMRMLLIFLCVAGLVVENATSQSAPSAFSIEITAPKAAKSGLPINLEITLVNTSNSEISIGRLASGRSELSYKLDVLDANDHSVPLTTYGRLIYKHECDTSTAADPQNTPEICSPKDSVVHTHLKPGEAVQQSIRLDRLFDMSKPGDYSIQVGRSDLTNIKQRFYDFNQQKYYEVGPQGETTEVSKDQFAKDAQPVPLVKSNVIKVSVTP